MKITTHFLIDNLPLDPALRDRIKDVYPNKLDVETKFELEQMIWSLYLGMYFNHINEVFQVKQDELAQGTATLDPQSSKTLQEKAGDDFFTSLTSQQENREIHRLRALLRAHMDN